MKRAAWVFLLIPLLVLSGLLVWVLLPYRQTLAQGALGLLLVIAALALLGLLLLGWYLFTLAQHARRMKQVEREHARLDVREREQRLRLEQDQHDVTRHLLLTRVHPDPIGNLPALIDIAQERVTLLPSGNFVQQQPHTYAPRIEYHYPKGLPAPDTVVVPEDAPLPGLAGPAAPTFADLLNSRQIVPHEETSILGFSQRVARRGPWAKLHSFFVVGISGSGKSSTVSYYAALGVMHQARLLIIDPDAEEDESISKRLAPLGFALLSPVASNPDGARRVLEIAKRELAHPGDYPVLWIIDEFSSIMRAAAIKGHPWQAIAGELALTAEDWAQRGRKRGRTTIAIGQISKASRTGGTELRASMTATFIHRLPVQQARLVIDSETASDAPNLDVGEVMVLLANSAEPYRMHIPYTTVEDMRTVARLMGEHGRSSGVQRPFIRDSNVVHLPAREDVEPEDETALNEPENVTERVLALSSQGLSKRAIIGELWGARPGGTQAWQQASRRYDEIMLRWQEGGEQAQEM